MTCIHCGRDAITRIYTLRCLPETGSSREIELRLCSDCLRELCAQSDVELVEHAPFQAAE
jgi:hypothetical protein